MGRIRIATRQLVRTPGFTLTAIVVLALAIGVNTSIFSVASAVLRKPLPYPGAERLVMVFETNLEAGLTRSMTSWPAFGEWSREVAAFDRTAVYSNQATLVLVGDGGPERLRANVVSSSYFDLVGVRPAAGRLFRREEDQGWDAHPVVVLSDGLWRRRFGASPAVVGASLTLSEEAYTVVGVLEPGFHDVGSADHETDVFVPVSMAPRVLGYAPELLDRRAARWLTPLARLRTGASLDAARSQLATAAARLESAYADTHRGVGLIALPLSEVVFGDLRAAILALVAAAAFVLLVGCANVANLLLVRAASRRRDLAVKSALGLSGARLVREALAEGLIVAGAGCALGVALAYAVNARVPDWLPVGLPPYVRLSPDPAALALAVALGLGTGAVFAVVPAVDARRRDLRSILQEGGRQPGLSRARGRFQRAMVVVEVAAAAALLVGALLTIRSFAALQRVDVGFRPAGLLTARLDLEGTRYASAEDLRRVGERLLESLASTPGVEAATLWGPRTLGQGSWYTTVFPEGRPVATQSETTVTRRQHVGPGTLGTLGIGLRAGRDFTADDRAGHTPVVIVSESLAQTLWPGESALGRRVQRWNPSDPNEKQPFEVVGVAADIKMTGRRKPDDNPRELYFAWLQVPRREVTVFVRGGRSAGLAAAVREAVRSADPALPLYDVATMDERLAVDAAPARFAATLMGGYALLAAGLALLGIYSVVAYGVRQREPEVGVRMAFGATRWDVLRLISMQTARLVGAGLALGLAAAGFGARLLGGLLYGFPAADPVSFVTVATGLGLAGLAGGLLPALRAARLDPVVALRK